MKLIHPPVICIHCNSHMGFWGSSEYSPDILSFNCSNCSNIVRQNFLFKSIWDRENDSTHYELTKLLSHNIIIDNYTFALFPDHHQLRVIHHLGNTIPTCEKWEFFNDITLTHQSAEKFINRMQKLKPFL